MNILIAEDEIVSRRLLEKFLTDTGHTVESVSNGVEAWERFSRRQVRIVISDWRMPDLDGLELCQKIRAATREGLYLLYSAFKCYSYGRHAPEWIFSEQATQSRRDMDAAPGGRADSIFRETDSATGKDTARFVPTATTFM